MCGVSTNNKPSLAGLSPTDRSNAYGFSTPSDQSNAGYFAGPTDSAGNPVGGGAPPADAPDLTDKLVRQKRAAQALMVLSGRGRASTMGGPIAGPTALGKTTAGR